MNCQKCGILRGGVLGRAKEREERKRDSRTATTCARLCTIASPAALYEWNAPDVRLRPFCARRVGGWRHPRSLSPPVYTWRHTHTHTHAERPIQRPRQRAYLAQTRLLVPANFFFIFFLSSIFNSLIRPPKKGNRTPYLFHFQLESRTQEIETFFFGNWNSAREESCGRNLNFKKMNWLQCPIDGVRWRNYAAQFSKRGMYTAVTSLPSQESTSLSSTTYGFFYLKKSTWPRRAFAYRC